MLKKTKIIVGLCCATIAISVFTPVLVTSIIKNKISNNNINNQNKNYFFDNKEFSSKADLLKHAKTLVTQNTQQQLKRDQWSIDWNNETIYFQNIEQLNQFLNHKILTYQVQSSVDLKTDTNSLILNNQLDKLYLGNANETITIYRGKDDSIHLSELEAKKSYLSIHDIYNFDNIYFRNKEELGTYLDKYFDEKYKNQLPTKRLNLIASDGTRSMPFELKNLDPANWINNQPSADAAYLTDFVSNYATKYLRIQNNNSEFKYSYYPEQEFLNHPELVMNKFDGYSYITTNSNSGKPNYLVDLDQSDDYTLFGPYYTKAGEEIKQITNPDCWYEVSGEDWKYVDNALDAQLFADFVNNIVNDDDNVQDNEIDLPFHIKHLQNETLTYFKSLYFKEPIVYANVLQLYNTMKKGKRYNVFYKLPILFIKTIEELIKYKADYNLIQQTKEYYELIAYHFDEKLHLFLPKDFLIHENHKDYFSFVDLFNFNSNNLDLNYDVEQLIGIIKTNYSKFFYAIKYLSACFVFYSQFPDVFEFNLKLISQVGGFDYEKVFVSKQDQHYLKLIFDMINSSDLSVVHNNFYTILKTNEFEKSKEILKKYIDELELKYYNQKIVGINNFIYLIQKDIDQVSKNFSSDFLFGQDSFFYNLPLNVVKSMMKFFDLNKKLDYKNTYRTLVLYKICFLNKIISSTVDLVFGTFSRKTLLNTFLSSLYKIGKDWFIKTYIQMPFIFLSMILNKTFEIADIKLSFDFTTFYDNVASIIEDTKDVLDCLKDFLPKLEKLFSAFEKVCKALPFINIALTVLSNLYKQEKTSFIFETEDVKYIWNGGLTHSILFGLINVKTSDITNMKMLEPMQINNARIKNQYYYRDRFYDDLNILKKEQLKDILNGRFTTNKIKTVYSFTKQKLPEDSNELLGFEQLGDFNHLEPNTLLFDIINELQNPSQYNKYQTDDCYIFANGYHFESDIKPSAICEVIDNIKPTKVAQLPNIINGYVDSQNELLPYMLPATSWIPLTGFRVNDTSRQYILADENLKNNNASTVVLENEVMKKFYNSFSVENKTILKKDLKNNANFSDFNSNVNNFNVYVINLLNSPTKIFLNKADAFNYLIKQLNFKVYDYYLTNTNYEYKNQVFETINDFYDYVIQQATKGE